MRVAVQLTVYLLFCWNMAAGQSKNREIVMYVEIGTLSEIIIPESYTTIQIPVQIVEMRDVPGRNKQVITVHPVIPQKTKTNLRIYTRNYDFNIKLYINWPKNQPTETLELSKYIPAKKVGNPLKSGARYKKNGARFNGETTSNGLQIINRLHADRIVTREDFQIKKLLAFYPRLLKPDKHAPAIIKNRVVFAMDHIFHYKGKIVFKATLWNKSKVPFHILYLSITYKEKTGVPGINQRESKSLTLEPFYKIYSRKLVPPGKKAHIIYITSKLSPQDSGYFNCLLLEKNGTRNFDFDIPSYIK